MSKRPRDLVTVKSFDAEAMDALMESEHGHFGSLVVTALSAATMAAVAVQVLGEKLMEAGMSQEAVERLVGDADDHDLLEQIRSHVGASCVKSAVGQWNCEAAGLADDPPVEPPPTDEVVRGPGFTIIKMEVASDD